MASIAMNHRNQIDYTRIGPQISRAESDAVAIFLRFCAAFHQISFTTRDADRAIFAVTLRSYKDIVRWTPETVPTVAEIANAERIICAVLDAESAELLLDKTAVPARFHLGYPASQTVARLTANNNELRRAVNNLHAETVALLNIATLVASAY